MFVDVATVVSEVTVPTVFVIVVVAAVRVEVTSGTGKLREQYVTTG